MAAVLETAIQMAKVEVTNKVRFAFWGAEESGLIGSTHYVTELGEAGRARIAAYLNFDMIASPNGGYFVFDGDNSLGFGIPAGAPGSGAIEALFGQYFAWRNIPLRETAATGGTDYVPFRAAGIPFGGLFTGASSVKSAEQAALWGGTAGVAFDPCYHLPCDTFDNVSPTLLEVNSDAVAYATLSLAMSTEAVNGKGGKGNFRGRPAAPTGSLDGALHVHEVTR